MTDLQWFEASPPRDVDLAAVTALVRPLSHRPRGSRMRTPLVVFEAWGIQGAVHWRIGMQRRLAHHLPRQLRAHLPQLGLRPVSRPERPAVQLGAELRLRSLSVPLRIDTAGAVSSELTAALGSLATGEAGVVQWLVGPSRRRGRIPQQPSLRELLGLRPKVEPDATAQRLWREKASEPLFACRGRIGATAGTTARTVAIITSLGSALKLTTTHGAGLRVGRATPSGGRRVNEVASPALLWSCLLNAGELAALIGWPVQDPVPDGLPVVGGHINPAPARLLVPDEDTEAQPGVRLLGESAHPTQVGELVSVPVTTSLHHLHVVGPTGSGKSTLLCGLVTADIAAGRGVLLVEPKGDLVRDVLARMPAERRDDVVVIDPAQAERTVGVNVLAGAREHAERRADQIVELLSELHGSNWGPRTADVALHALLTVSRLPDGTLTDVPVLLGNPVFRRQVLNTVNDPLVLGPWWAWYDNLSAAERGQVIAPLLNKLRAFQSRDALRRMLGQAEPRFALDELFTKRRVVLVNLNKGLLGGPTASLLGVLLLTQLWAAIQRRTGTPADKRHPVMVVIDEYQDYLHIPGLDLGDALAQARGLGVSLTLAHQHLDQLSPRQRAAILANARSRVVFRPAVDDAKHLASALGGGVTSDDLLRLKAFEACTSLLVDGAPSPPFTVRTRPLPLWTSNPDELARASAVRYGVDGTELDAQQTERWQGGDAPAGPIGVKTRRRP